MLESPRMSDVSPYPPRQLIVLHYYANISPAGTRGIARVLFPSFPQASKPTRQIVFAGVFDASPFSSSLRLDLLGTPAGVGLAHVGGGLDGRDELEDGVADTDQADDGAGNDAEDAAAEEDGSDEDVDCIFMGNAGQRGEQEKKRTRPELERIVASAGNRRGCVLFGSQRGSHVQIPRPTKEKRNEAYRETWGGIWNSRSPTAAPNRMT